METEKRRNTEDGRNCTDTEVKNDKDMTMNAKGNKHRTDVMPRLIPDRATRCKVALYMHQKKKKKKEISVIAGQPRTIS